MKDQLASWCRSIDLLREADELDAALFETPQQFNQMGQ